MPDAESSRPDSSGSNDSESERMRRLIAAYDSFEDAEGRSEFLASLGLTYPVIGHYRRMVALADRKSASAQIEATVRIRTTRRRRVRRTWGAPPLPSGTTRPGGEPPIRNRLPRMRVTVVITIDFP